MSDSTFIPIPHYSDPAYTIFYCVRHAEKRKDQGDNPELSDEGVDRAKQLSIIMSGEKLDKVFSTNYKRTIQTAETVRKGAGKKPPAAATYPPAMQDAWLDEALSDSKGKHFLVVGHSNTIPELLNRLTGSATYQNIPDDDYDRFYIAVTKGIGQTEVVELRYTIIVSQNPATPN
ncbi:MAG TPA: histidine phosphatase family protein, partial [Saprospiraceae bacterium]|nr:histidine phosphatase family protein [Saprospiraceae bacterium]